MPTPIRHTGRRVPRQDSRNDSRGLTIEDEVSGLYGFLFRNARDIVLFIEPAGGIVEANNAAVAAYGYTRDELLSMSVYDLRAADLAPDIAIQLANANSAGTLFETVHRRKDGSLFPVEVNSQGTDLSGRRLLLSVVRDITERKRAEQALAAEERRYQTLFNQLVEAFAVHEIIKDDEGHPVDYRFLNVNPAFERMTGLSGSAILGKTVRQVLPEIEQDWIDTYGRVALTGETVRFESYAQSLGRYYEVVAFRPADGQFATLFFDVTPRRSAEEKSLELAVTAERKAAELQSVLDNMADSVLVAEPSGRLVMVNKAGLRLLGLRTMADLPRGVFQFRELTRARDRLGDPVPPSSLPLARALAGETVELQDLIIYNADSGKDVHTLSNASPIRDSEGKIVAAVALLRDVTDLTALDRLKDQFITVAAHELKTPVAVMKGYAQLLLRESQNLPEQHRRYLSAINRGSDRMNHVVNDLLEVSRFQLGGMQFRRSAVRLDELVRGVAEQFALSTATHSIHLQVTAKAIVSADSSRLEQVLLTLLDNAVKYSASGTSVEVEATIDGGEAVVTVRDSGVGIPGDKQARIFDLFYRAHTGTAWDYGGMGVGLYLARETIAGLGGRIWFESEEGVGSAFHFALPLEAPDGRT